MVEEDNFISLKESLHRKGARAGVNNGKKRDAREDGTHSGGLSTNKRGGAVPLRMRRLLALKPLGKEYQRSKRESAYGGKCNLPGEELGKNS